MINLDCTMPSSASNQSIADLELFIQGIKPTQKSFNTRIFIDQPNADHQTVTENNQHFLGEVYMYGFGAGMDKQNALLEGVAPTEHQVPPAPPYDACLSLQPVSHLFTQLPEKISVTLVPVDEDKRPLADEFFQFQSITVVPQQY